jgi:hypothetical protein
MRCHKRTGVSGLVPQLWWFAADSQNVITRCIPPLSFRHSRRSAPGRIVSLTPLKLIGSANYQSPTSMIAKGGAGADRLSIRFVRHVAAPLGTAVARPRISSTVDNVAASQIRVIYDIDMTRRMRI